MRYRELKIQKRADVINTITQIIKPTPTTVEVGVILTRLNPSLTDQYQQIFISSSLINTIKKHLNLSPTNKQP